MRVLPSGQRSTGKSALSSLAFMDRSYYGQQFSTSAVSTAPLRRQQRVDVSTSRQRPAAAGGRRCKSLPCGLGTWLTNPIFKIQIPATAHDYLRSMICIVAIISLYKSAFCGRNQFVGHNRYK